ncbi:MAG TPA: dienelactone hydrolase family protein [Aggregatilineales bacterium]|nr:dienelactone hydrolase family protein [Aggregatilineales bacterium]
MSSPEAVRNVPDPQIVAFPSGSLTLKGLLWKPIENGNLPAVLFNHGSEPSAWEGGYSTFASWFVRHGYVLFIPFRRGHNLSSDQGPYIGALLDQTRAEEGDEAWSRLMVSLLEGDHLNDQLAALSYLKTLPFVDDNRVAVAGGSFGGIQVVLAAEAATSIRAAVDFAGASMTWAHSELLRQRMLVAVRNARCPIYFIQAENDFDVSPSRVLAAEMQRLGKPHRITIFPPFGETAMDGHLLGSRGGDIWEQEVFAFLADSMK